MSLSHQFGGQWTEEKLRRIKDYLSAYMKIFKSNERARYLTTHYIDAFAGTGYRTPTEGSSVQPLFEDEDARSLQKGSAYIALETEPSFDKFVFIEKSKEHFEELARLREQFPEKAEHITILQEEANKALQTFCQDTNWRKNRAVVFLDPYGMAVEWETIEAIALTKAIDLWVLFPLGQAVNRLLIRDRLPDPAWSRRLTLFFGTEEWQGEFYKVGPQPPLFPGEPRVVKDADFETIAGYFIRRLNTVFEGVAESYLPLRNSVNVPIYLLCFAAGNPKGAKPAIKIANHLLREERG